MGGSEETAILTDAARFVLAGKAAVSRKGDAVAVLIDMERTPRHAIPDAAPSRGA